MSSPSTPSSGDVDDVTCTTLRVGVPYAIKEHPSHEEIADKMLKIYGTGQRYIPRFVLKNGQRRKVIILRPVEITDTQVKLLGLLPNGNSLAMAEIVLSDDDQIITITGVIV